MNHVMWEKTATQRNVDTLRTWGVTVLDPGTGPQACGEVGPGRMQEPEQIVQHLAQSRSPGSLDGVQVMVTAGPTWEALDPVRALTNHSSGKMGYAVATAARLAGASVTLISGPTALTPPTGVQVESVVSAQEMLAAVESQIDSTDILICAAAVADYRPADIMTQKMKKDAPEITIKLVRNTDILASMAARSSPPFIVGFAAETEKAIDNARDKLKRKKVDLMVANLVESKDKPFGSDRNALVLVDRNTETDLGQDTKVKLATNLIDEIAKRFHAKDPAEST
jgi:phosphopantothenoylcysteine decarboxylase/phosphopantothenate--cysteine ligase